MRKGKRHIVLVGQNKDGEFYGSCTCGQNSGPNHFPKKQRWKAEDWCREHAESVQHALAVLHRHRGSLRIERDHALKMMNDPNVPADQKAMWKILFDGAEARLRDNGSPNPATDGLW